MKNIIKSLFILAVLVGMVGCEKEYETEGNFKVTFFPDIVVAGDMETFAPANTPYVDAGVATTENGVAIQTDVDNGVDVTTPGFYEVVFSAENVDGFSKSVTREVIVYATNGNTTDYSGAYTGAVDRTTLSSGSKRAYNGNPVTLTKVPGATGVYAISDWIAGFYDVGAAYKYGPGYRFTGYIQILDDNSVIHLSSKNPWGDPLEDLSGSIDPATGTITYDADWIATYNYAMILTKD